MKIRYGCELTFEVQNPTPTQCLIDIHPDRRHDIRFEQPTHVIGGAGVTSEADVNGNCLRRFMAPAGVSTVRLLGVLEDSGVPMPSPLYKGGVPVQSLPTDTLIFLNGSRYCETDMLTATAWQLFGHMTPGGSMVQAICDFVNRHISFGYGHARATRTAADAYREQVGVCRDFAHLAITLCRCMNIPARYVNGYLGDIGVPANSAPMDFNAWFEAYIEGGWHTFDARHNELRIGRLPIARGRDAADVPMLQTFGPHTLLSFSVTTEQEIDPDVRVAA